MDNTLCLGRISQGKYTRFCSDECPNAALCACLAVLMWLYEVNKYYEKGE